MISVVAFFILTFALTWTAWFGAGHLASPGARAILLLVGTFSPAIWALVLTARNEGSDGLMRIWARIARVEVRARWYCFAITFTLAVKLGVAVVYRVAEARWPAFGQESWLVIAAAIVVSTPVQAGEEIGWRGYALPRLAGRMGLRGASLLLGIVWAAWHLPLFFLAGTDKTGQSFPLFAAQVTALSVAIAWLYARTGGSLLLTMLMHSATNQVVGIVPSAVPGATNVWALNGSLPGWLTAALLWTAAVYFLVDMPPASSLGPTGAGGRM